MLLTYASIALPYLDSGSLQICRYTEVRECRQDAEADRTQRPINWPLMWTSAVVYCTLRLFSAGSDFNMMQFERAVRWVAIWQVFIMDYYAGVRAAMGVWLRFDDLMWRELKLLWTLRVFKTRFSAHVHMFWGLMMKMMSSLARWFKVV